MSSRIDNIKYYLADCEKKILFTYRSLANTQKLKAFLNSLPRVRKENTFPILEIERNNGVIICNFEKYYNKNKKLFHVLEYKVDEEDVDNKGFFYEELDCHTTAYNVYIKWEEDPELAEYIFNFDRNRRLSSNLDISYAYSLICIGQAKVDNYLI